MRAFLHEVGVAGVVDILLMALLIYSVLVLLKRTRRATLALTGILIVALIYLTARQFDLLLTVAVLQGFFAVILVALVVIFQEELRNFFEQIAQWGLGKKLPSKRRGVTLPGHIEILVRTAGELAEQRIGALMVLRGNDLLVRHLDGGELLGGQISEALIKSLFDPHSVGHDGAVVIDEGLIQAFGCHLPLSRNRELIGHDGTRHAAALGLAERTDALCLVVSEERGTISVARGGRIRRVVTSELRTVLADFLGETAPERESGAWRRFFAKNPWDKLIAVGLATVLWFVVVHESALVYRTFHLPVTFAHVPSDLRITRVEPAEVEVTLSASRKSMYFFKQKSMGLAVRTWDLEPGPIDVDIVAADLLLPQGAVLENIRPRSVRIDVDRAPAPASGESGDRTPAVPGATHRQQATEPPR